MVVSGGAFRCLFWAAVCKHLETSFYQLVYGAAERLAIEQHFCFLAQTDEGFLVFRVFSLGNSILTQLRLNGDSIGF